MVYLFEYDIPPLSPSAVPKYRANAAPACRAKNAATAAGDVNDD